MAIYRIATPPTIKTENADRKIHVAWASSEGAAKKERRRLSEAYAFKLNDVTYKEVDTGKGKAGLIVYLNTFHTQLPGDYTDPAPAKAAKKKK
jgi:hypothetical protein